MAKAKHQFGANVVSDQGSTVQVLKGAADADVLLTLTPVPNGGQVQSGVVKANGFKGLAVGVKSTQIGALNVQRFIDEAGTIPVGAVLTAALAANVSNWVSVNDGQPFAALQITVTNTSGTNATLSAFGILLQSI